MRWIIDANCLIYLIKAGISDRFRELSGDDLAIDTSVYHEVVERGMQLNYPDASQVGEFLKKYQVPIIPAEIQADLSKFNDLGETSCYVLCKQGGTCISSDHRAIKRFIQNKTPTSRLDGFFYGQYLEHRVSLAELEKILDAIERVHGISSKRKNIVIEEARRQKQEEEQHEQNHQHPNG